MKQVAVILFLLGMVLFGVGMSMRTKQIAFTTIHTEVIGGNRGKAVAIGATTGAVVGGSAGAMVGGVGIALCGTGIGIPAGVVCLATAGVCALIGGGVGLAAGTPDTTVSTPEIIIENAYQPWEYWVVIIAGCLIMSIGMFYIIKGMRHSDNGKSDCV